MGHADPQRTPTACGPHPDGRTAGAERPAAPVAVTCVGVTVGVTVGGHLWGSPVEGSLWVSPVRVTVARSSSSSLGCLYRCPFPFPVPGSLAPNTSCTRRSAPRHQPLATRALTPRTRTAHPACCWGPPGCARHRCLGRVCWERTDDGRRRVGGPPSAWNSDGALSLWGAPKQAG